MVVLFIEQEKDRFYLYLIVRSKNQTPYQNPRSFS
jgi:hypothetical protein